jgi:hypothetical protein
MGVGAQTSGKPGTDMVTLTRSDAGGSSVTKTLSMKGKAGWLPANQGPRVAPDDQAEDHGL